MPKTEKLDETSGAALVLNQNKAIVGDDILAGIKSAQDAFDVLAEMGATVDDFNDYGNGFALLKDKSQLAGKTFVIIQWKFNPGDYGDFVSAAVVTEAGEKLVLNDGSTGICDQLIGVTAKRVADGIANTQSGLIVRGGLRVSEYTKTDEQGKDYQAKTWYLTN